MTSHPYEFLVQKQQFLHSQILYLEKFAANYLIENNNVAQIIVVSRINLEKFSKVMAVPSSLSHPPMHKTTLCDFYGVELTDLQ